MSRHKNEISAVVAQTSFRREIHLGGVAKCQLFSQTIEISSFVTNLDCEQSLFFLPLPSRAFSHARGHLRVSGVLLDGQRKKETARSLLQTEQRSKEISVLALLEPYIMRVLYRDLFRSST